MVLGWFMKPISGVFWGISSKVGHLFPGRQFDPQPTCPDRTPATPEPLEGSSGRNTGGLQCEDQEASDENSFAIPVAFLCYDTYFVSIIFRELAASKWTVQTVPVRKKHPSLLFQLVLKKRTLRYPLVLKHGLLERYLLSIPFPYISLYFHMGLSENRVYSQL